MCILRILCVLLAGSISIGWAATFDKNRGAKTLSDLDPEQPEQSTDAAVSTKIAKEKEKRFEWNKRTIVGDYERVGKRSPKWDEAVLRALNSFVKMRSYGTNAVPNQIKEIAEPCKEAIAAGCDDVLVRYINTRYVVGGPTKGTKDAASAYFEVATQFHQTKYSDIRKFYAYLRSAQAIKAAASGPTASNTPPEVLSLRRSAAAYLKDALQDKTMPAAEVYDACNDLMETTKLNKPQYERFFLAIEPALLSNWSQESLVQRLRGEFYTHYAWNARGSGFADTVTEEGARLFEERLAIAEAALESAWRLDPTDEWIANDMLIVEKGQGKGRDRMELWFRRAMALNTNNYAACSRKLTYLEPKWYGSPEEVLSFGRECVNSTKWGGRIPWISVQAHSALATYLDEDERKGYWREPDVWADLKAGFEKYFSRYPNAERKRYAWYAYQCEQWADFIKQVNLMNPIDYAYFGGKEKFEGMMRRAKEHSAEPKR